MKILAASIFALVLLGAGAANAEGVGVGAHVGGNGVGVGAHVGNVGVVVGVSTHSRHHRCSWWGWRHHHHERYCRRWHH